MPEAGSAVPLTPVAETPQRHVAPATATWRRSCIAVSLMSGPTPIARPLRVAFVGAGRMARLHLHALRRVRTPHVVAAVCDTSEAAARGLAESAGSVPYGSLAKLLREAKPDVVHVCTPAGTHVAPARQALLAGAHVYVEKPFVEVAAEARELLALAR